jgi:hypothetical protein|nr:MAG: hypothetical protein DIU57_04610 [Pseudomonadota bacterium]
MGLIPVRCVQANGLTTGYLQMFTTLRGPASLLLGAVLVAGCSSDGAFLGSPITTGSIQPAMDPACVQLTTEIDGLMKEGVAEKVEKAAANKYRLKKADLVKADRLNKANAEFQNRCALNPTRSAGTTAEAKPAEGAGQGGANSQGAAATKSAEAGKASGSQTKTQ